MFRKTLIAIAAVGTLAFGMATASSTANAGVTITIGNGYHHGWHGNHFGKRCTIKRVKVRQHHKWVWRKVRTCNRVSGYAPHGPYFLPGHGHNSHWNHW